MNEQHKMFCIKLIAKIIKNRVKIMIGPIISDH